MGLDTSHDCWHGSYTSFNRFRAAVAAEFNIPLELMEGFYGMPGRTDFSLPDDIAKALPIKWESLIPQPIHLLLHHSDCDGEIEAKDCVAIAEQLEAAAARLGGSGDIRGSDSKDAALQFAAGLRRAAERGEDVEFH